jgi:hypothetical protein
MVWSEIDVLFRGLIARTGHPNCNDTPKEITVAICMSSSAFSNYLVGRENSSVKRADEERIPSEKRYLRCHPSTFDGNSVRTNFFG